MPRLGCDLHDNRGGGLGVLAARVRSRGRRGLGARRGAVCAALGASQRGVQRERSSTTCSSLLRFAYRGGRSRQTRPLFALTGDDTFGCPRVRLTHRSDSARPTDPVARARQPSPPATLMAVTEEGLVYRPEVLGEYGFLGTPNDLIEDLRNGIQLHGAEGVSFEIWHALTPEERDAAAGGEAIRYTTPQREREAQLVRTFQMLHRADGTVTHPPTMRS